MSAEPIGNDWNGVSQKACNANCGLLTDTSTDVNGPVEYLAWSEFRSHGITRRNARTYKSGNDEVVVSVEFESRDLSGSNACGDCERREDETDHGGGNDSASDVVGRHLERWKRQVDQGIQVRNKDCCDFAEWSVKGTDNA